MPSKVTDAPRLETARLVLAARTAADFDDYAAMWADPVVTRYTAGAPVPLEESWRNFARLAGLWRLTGYGPWIVREKMSGAFVGDVGPADYRRDSEPKFDHMVEFGWALAPDFHGRGYATEALQAALRWSRVHLGGRRFCAMIDPENAPSRAVAAKCGFSRAGEVLYRGKTLDFFTLSPG